MRTLIHLAMASICARRFTGRLLCGCSPAYRLVCHIALMLIVTLAAMPGDFDVVAAEPSRNADAARDATESNRPDRCRFHYAEANVGDVGQQSMRVQLDLLRKLSQGGTEISADQMKLQRQQDRQIRVTEVGSKVATRVFVAFRLSQQALEQPGQERVTQSQPVHGKTYDVARVGEELVVRYPNSSELPPAEELEIVAAAMAALGRPSPLGELLDNQTIQVGQQIEVPAEMVRDFLGMQTDPTSTMRLQLESVQGTRERPHAVFAAVLQLSPTPNGDFGMHVTGRWEVDAATCQTISATFHGPVRSFEKRGPEGAQFLISTEGDLDLRLTRTSETVTR